MSLLDVIVTSNLLNEAKLSPPSYLKKFEIEDPSTSLYNRKLYNRTPSSQKDRDNLENVSQTLKSLKLKLENKNNKFITNNKKPMTDNKTIKIKNRGGASVEDWFG